MEASGSTFPETAAPYAARTVSPSASIVTSLEALGLRDCVEVRISLGAGILSV